MQHKNFCAYQRRTWDQFMRVLSLAHASQPIERADYLEYRNRLSDVCWGAVYWSIESIFFNHTIICVLTFVFFYNDCRLSSLWSRDRVFKYYLNAFRTSNESINAIFSRYAVKEYSPIFHSICDYNMSFDLNIRRWMVNRYIGFFWKKKWVWLLV